MFSDFQIVGRISGEGPADHWYSGKSEQVEPKLRDGFPLEYNYHMKLYQHQLLDKKQNQPGGATSQFPPWKRWWEEKILSSLILMSGEGHFPEEKKFLISHIKQL